jgi:hypothetical protein
LGRAHELSGPGRRLQRLSLTERCASTYQQLNTAVVTQTSYVDTGVQDGQSYDYIVESVDSSGIESAPSNTATVPIP